MDQRQDIMSKSLLDVSIGTYTLMKTIALMEYGWHRPATMQSFLMWWTLENLCQH